MVLDPDLEMEFIREFAVGGMLHRGTTVRDRREHIRAAIYKGNLLHKPFRETGVSYAQVYERCFGARIEIRTGVRGKTKGNPPE